MIRRSWVITLFLGMLAALGVAGGADLASADVADANVGTPGTNCAPTAGSVTVAIVIDDGQSSPRTGCVTVAKGTAAATALGTRATYDGSGLLCSIDGYPRTGCGEAAGNGAYTYWSYWWKDGNTWKYATTGPATRRLTADGMVEGWHFITGRDTGEGNAPRLDPTSVTFSASPPATTPTITQAPPTSAPATFPGQRPVTAGSGTNIAPSTGRAGSVSPTIPAPPGSAPTTIVVGVGPDAVGTDATSSVPGAAGAFDGASTDPEPHVAGGSVTRAEPIAATTPDGSGTGGLVGVAVVAIAIAGVATSVTIRRRRTP